MPNELLETWELYRQNLALHVPGSPLPRCPICHRPMHRPGDRNPAPGTVPPSRGHVAPKTTGDDERHVVIECSACNSRSGLRFDAFYADQVMNDRARCRKVEVDTFARYLNNRRHPYFVNGIPARVEATVCEGKISARMQIDGEFDHEMEAGNIECQLRNPPTVRVVVSILHSAYLRLFWHLGYEYVLHPSVQGLRCQLAAALDGIPLTDRQLVPFRRYFPCILRQERPNEGWSGLTVITRPVELQSFLVFVPGMQTRAYATMMPGFDGASGLRKRAKRAEGCHASAFQLGSDAAREDRLRTAEFSTWGRAMWDMVHNSPVEPRHGHVFIGD